MLRFASLAPPLVRPAARLYPLLAAFLLSLLLAQDASAQIYAVFLKDPKQLKRLAGHAVEVNGELALIGEAKAGINLVNGQTVYQGGKGNNEFWLVFTADPSTVPYKLDAGEYVTDGKKGGTVSLIGDQILRLQSFMPRQSLYGLAREYAIRRTAVAESQTRRDAHKAGSPEWATAHVRLLAQMQQLMSWLDSTCFPLAAKKLATEIEKQGKQVAKEARAQRLANALASIQMVPTPSKLTDLAKTLAPEKSFKVAESLHLRFTYESALADDQVKTLLELGERMIDGFRAEFVDPWLASDFTDGIPDRRFMEFWWGPEEPPAHERFLTDWYGTSWGGNKEQRVAAMSGRYRRNDDIEYLDYWKIADNKDFDAIVAHQLGHVLANLHYNQNRKGDLPNWIEEGVGYWLALSYLGKNGVTCKEFAKESYAKPSAAAIEHSVFLGETEIFTTLALEHGAAIDTLLRKPLHQMEDADLAKAWSFFEYVGKQEGKPGQQWLRAVCELYSVGTMSIDPYRTKSETLFAVSGEDVFKLLDRRWKARAEEVQKVGLEPRKK
ncbi:MAG: hypothetical protein EXS13_10080 [Planctomycetes bacterium]|nr:hypothetical protein [Planctomycetota bacterium]